ncbi:MAG: tyrosine-type recombinase/integrase [Desulfobacterales bacterium]|nr:tyrosine-type recombinase/integrase [Desulfobacterales bacterium]
MSRTNSPHENPNYLVGCHPVSGLEEPDFLFNEVATDRSIPSSRFTSASFYDGVIHWKQQSTLRRQALDRVIARVIGHKVPGEGHVLSYLQHMYRRNCRPKTICSTASSLVLFLLFIKQNQKEYIELIMRRDLEAFVEHEQDRTLKPKTIHFRLQVLYAFFRYLVKESVMGPELLERKIRLRVPQSLPKAICTPDILRLLSVIDHTRDRTMILTLLRTGMRIGELLGLRVNDVDLTERTVKIYQGEKNSVGRVVYLNEDACEALNLWLQERNPRRSYLFYGQQGPLGYTASRDRFIHYLEKAGLAEKGYTLHCLRHTFATDLLNAGMRLECLQQLLGHSKIEVTRIYARLSDTAREEEYFRAMTKIERGETDEYHRLDCQL